MRSSWCITIGCDTLESGQSTRLTRREHLQKLLLGVGCLNGFWLRLLIWLACRLAWTRVWALNPLMIMSQVLIKREEVWKDDVKLARQKIEMLTSA